MKVYQQDITLENIYVRRNIRVKDSLNLIYWLIITKNKLNRQKIIYTHLVKKRNYFYMPRAKDYYCYFL